jgi:hypothetical protein
MGLFDGLRNRLVGFMQGVFNDAFTARSNDILGRREFRFGIQKRQIKPGKFDDNLVMNFAGLAVDRGVSMLFGKEVDFEFEQGEGTAEEYVENTPQQDFIEEAWEANNKQLLLHDLAEDGAEAGTCYVKIIPDGVTHNDNTYPRLVVLDPAFLDMGCARDDMDKVTRYTIQYKADDENGKEVAYREITEWLQTSDTEPDTGYWLITHQINKNGKWEPDPSIVDVNWEYDFAPIVHWKNLPFSHSMYGMPDVTPDVVELQDRLNFIASNMSKIIRLYAHPQRWSRFFGKDPGQVTLGPDDMPNVQNEKGEIFQLNPVADLETSRLFGLNLRQSLFDITRTVDITSIADKLGTLTNFGLHVLYMDALSKLETKRSLYGWGLCEINRRMMILKGMDALENECVWENPLPENIQEAMTVDQGQLGMGIVSKQTVSEHEGYDWEKEQTRMKEEQGANADLGTQLLNAFNKGQGGNIPQPAQPQIVTKTPMVTNNQMPMNNNTPGGAQ